MPGKRKRHRVDRRVRVQGRIGSARRHREHDIPEANANALQIDSSEDDVGYAEVVAGSDEIPTGNAYMVRSDANLILQALAAKLHHDPFQEYDVLHGMSGDAESSYRHAAQAQG